ncbi:MAG TPA: zf-HC2 domain-containing protein [Polyangiaceae bacterium]|nr:zf-HC2 domain-containing protein [Polyangiaceae bacterium]
MSAMDCTRASELIFDHVAGRLSDAERAELEGHLRDCAACRRAVDEERATAELLKGRLPRRDASEALKQRLARAALAAGERRRRRSWPLALSAAAFALGLVAFVFYGLGPRRSLESPNPLIQEALNDHLRVLYAEHPIEVESGGIHQVKPWFTGRLDFAPIVAFDGDDQYSLKGGTVGYFIDRKAAVFVYKLRLHTLSLLVFRAAGLPWPEATVPIGAHQATVTAVRGFHVVMLRDGDLGYAAVSDVATPDLVELMSKVEGGQ